ncbi:MAG: DUF4258 domain-containing protein [Acidobacteria bacterium]|nr:DUF4258 domain-containing protein [Acidobacteriota bacterium]
MTEPFSPTQARQRIRRILLSGSFSYSSHALREMEKDGLAPIDCVNVLRAAIVEPAEFEHGSWRYRVRSAYIWVVVAFRSESELRVVTAWRGRP